jgi:hypothetical protein
MRVQLQVLTLAGLSLLSAAAARPPAAQAAVLPAWAMLPAQAATPAVTLPETPAGRALGEFVDSFNAGGKTRQTWLETRTTVEDEPRANMLELDAQLLQKYGPLKVVRIVNSSQQLVAAVIRHGTSDLHGYLTISVEPAAPHKVVDLGLRAATPEEIKGSAGE